MKGLLKHLSAFTEWLLLMRLEQRDTVKYGLGRSSVQPYR